MTAEELYAILDAADLDYDVVQIWDGLRTINFEVCTDEEEQEEQEKQHELIPSHG